MKAALKRLFAKEGSETQPPSTRLSSQATQSTATLASSSPSESAPVVPFLEKAPQALCAASANGDLAPLPCQPTILIDALSSSSSATMSAAWPGTLRKARTQGPTASIEHTLVTPVTEQGERAFCGRIPAFGQRLGSVEAPLALEELPSVDHLAESGWTRALTGNIKSIAQIHSDTYGNPGASSPNSPYPSQLDASTDGARRQHSSAMGDSGLDANAAKPSSGSLPQPQRGLTMTTSLEDDDTGDEDFAAGALPSVLPAALLLEAAKTGTNLEVNLAAEVVFAAEPPLGRGVSGTVFKAAYNGQPCAVKMLPPDMLFGSGSSELHTFVQEVVVLASIRHPNIVTFLGASLQPPNVFLIAELCTVSLDAWVHQGAGGGPMSSWQRLKVALDVATGLKYLHERQPAIVHRDLKPANILIDASGTAKIIDFGLARVKTTSAITTKATEVGSIGYMAPECFTSEDGVLTDKCDTWSLGVVLWEMVARKRPWPGASLVEYYREVVVRKSRLQIPQDDNVCPMALRKLISSCWNDSPDDRPSCGHIVAELSRLLKYCPRD